LVIYKRETFNKDYCVRGFFLRVDSAHIIENLRTTKNRMRRVKELIRIIEI